MKGFFGLILFEAGGIDVNASISVYHSKMNKSLCEKSTKKSRVKFIPHGMHTETFFKP
jgi:hypothetical protein